MPCPNCFNPALGSSSSLKDLRNLITEGLFKSDVLVLMLTTGFLTRPWCLLEIYFAKKRGVPIVLVNILSAHKFDQARTIEYLNDLSAVMGRDNPSGLAVLEKELDGVPVKELQDTVIKVLQERQVHLTWNPSAGDEAMVTSLKDIVQQIAIARGRELVNWSSTPVPTLFRKTTSMLLAPPKHEHFDCW